MAQAQKPDFVFRRNGEVHLNRRGRQFSRLLADEVCASAVVMLDTPRSEVLSECWLPTPLASFLCTSPPVRHRVPSGFKRTLSSKNTSRLRSVVSFESLRPGSTALQHYQAILIRSFKFIMARHWYTGKYSCD